MRIIYAFNFLWLKAFECAIFTVCFKIIYLDNQHVSQSLNLYWNSASDFESSNNRRKKDINNFIEITFKLNLFVITRKDWVSEHMNEHSYLEQEMLYFYNVF